MIKSVIAMGIALAFLMSAARAAELPVDLGAAGTFAILGGSTVTNVATVGTIVTGDIGLSPGNLTGITGFPPGVLTGTLWADDNGTVASSAQSSLTTAYNDAAGRPGPPVAINGNIAGMTLAPNLYKSTSSLEITGGDLTLDAGGDSNAIWIFQIATTLTSTSGGGGNVILSGGAQACNVFWQVGSSATLGTGTFFKGNILALDSITITTGVNLDGRALARNGAVTLDNNLVSTCIQSTPLPTLTATGTPTNTSVETATPTPSPTIGSTNTPTPSVTPSVTPTPCAAPINDLCAAAICLFDGEVIHGSTLAAGNEGAVTLCGGTDFYDVWYSYSPQTAGPVAITANFTVADGSASTISVFTGCGGAELACGNNNNTVQAAILPNLDAGLTYLIRVGAAQGLTGDFVIAVLGGGGLCAAPGIPKPGPAAGLANVFDEDFTGSDLHGWYGGVVSGAPSASTSTGASGLCMTVPLAGDNVLCWVSPSSAIPLVAGVVYRARTFMHTTTTAMDAIPFWNLIYDNMITDQELGNNLGGEAWILDGGAEGIERAEGRTTYDFYFAPNAIQLPQWNGQIDPEDSAFSPAIDPFNDLRVYVRVLDLDNAVTVGGNDFGPVCMSRIRIDSISLDELRTGAQLVYSPPITNADFFVETFSQRGDGQASVATINDLTNEGIIGLIKPAQAANPAVDPPNTARRTFGPNDPLLSVGGLANYVALYPVAWASNQLYMGTIAIRSISNGCEPDPIDVLSVVFDTGTNELGQTHASTRGGTGNMHYAASPRIAGVVPIEQVYTGFFFTQNETLSPNAEQHRLRMMADFYNRSDIGIDGTGTDPVAITGANIYKLTVPLD